jgi:hypothetical protein
VSSEKWVNHFSNLFQAHKPNDLECDILKERKELEDTPIFNRLSFPFSEKEVSNAIKKLKTGKAAGPDQILGEMLKCGADILQPLLVKLFNKILSHGLYPKVSAEGIIVPILKKGDPSVPDNYRGITISSALGKLFGIILNERLQEFCSESNLIDECQIGFKKKARTTDHMFIIRTLIEKYCKKGKKPLYACFVDFQKAFDSIWHEAMLVKLLRCEIGGPFYKIIKSMYENISSTVKTNANSLVGQLTIVKGVKQGDIISPLLFNIFLNDITLVLNESICTPPFLSNKSVGCLLYADDLVIMSETEEGLQCSLDHLNMYCIKWKLDVNVRKSKVLIFNGNNETSKSTFSVGNVNLEIVHEYTYLGIVFTDCGSFKKAQSVLCEKAKRAMFKLKKIIIDTNLKPSIQCKLFDQLIKPICLYGCEIWGLDQLQLKDGLETSTHKLEESYDKLLCEKLNLACSRFILGVHKKAQNSAVRGELGRYPLGISVMCQASKYFDNLMYTDKDCLLNVSFDVYHSTSGNNARKYIGKIKKLRDALQQFPELASPKKLKLTLQESYRNY